MCAGCSASAIQLHNSFKRLKGRVGLEEGSCHPQPRAQCQTLLSACTISVSSCQCICCLN